MNEKAFNLMDEPWIRVIDNECRVDEISLIELFQNAQNYKDLCGEIPTQDFALLRLLLAILHTVISRFDVNGEPSPIEDEETALDRWREIWDAGKFPDNVISDYLVSQRESFYLFHPERPFYQCEHAKVGTSYTTAKLYGDLSESNNKVRMFSMISGEEKNAMTFSEAARWLIYVNAFDDTSAKKSAESRTLGLDLPSVGAGWIGKLGLLCVSGNNLFETLMLNLILVYDENTYPKEKPIWELEKIRDGERIAITAPDNLAQLYTLQSRRLYLKREGQKVTGFYLLGGDFFEKENAFIEPMTVWRNSGNKNNNVYVPKRHDISRQFWRDFSALVVSADKSHKPGVVSWINLLDEKDVLKDRILDFKIASVQYGDKDFFVTNIFSDAFQLHSSLVAEMNSMWQNMICDCIEFSEQIANKVWVLAQNINIASGGDETSTSKNFANQAKSDFYIRIDLPFRKWLCAIDPAVDNAYDRKIKWREDCVKIARQLGNDMIAKIDSSAIFGKRKSIDKKENKKIFSAAKAMNSFLAQLKKAETT